MEHKPEDKKIQTTLDELRGDLNVSLGAHQLTLAQLNWQRYAIIPFSIAYSDAFKNYETTIENDTKEQKALMDLAVGALSLFGGSMIASVLGKLTLKEKAKDLAIGFICDNNLKATFNMAYKIEKSPAARFVVGQAWDNSTKWMGEKTQAMFTSTETAMQYSKIRDPGNMDRSLDLIFTDTRANLLHALLDLQSSRAKDVDPKIKKIILENILRAPFANAPSQPVFKTEELTDQIELGFYMQLILASDYTAESFESRTFPFETYQTKGQPINTSVNSKDYPKDSLFNGIGDNVVKKINELYRKPHCMNKSKDLISHRVGMQYANVDILREAEAVLQDMYMRTKGKISKQLPV